MIGPRRGCAILETERFWEELLQLIDEEGVVPIVGQDLLTVSDDGRETLLYPHLASRLAERLHVSADDLSAGDELQEVARRYLARAQNPQDVYRELRAILRKLDRIAVPRPLALLAKISKFKLFVTTTFDYLTERALNEEFFRGQRQTLVFSYAPSDKQDLPREFERLKRPALFHLMGRLSGTPGSYAVTEKDRLDYLQSLHSKAEDSPNILLDKLRRSHLLIMGSHLTDWLVPLFGRNLGTPESVNEGSVVFLRQDTGGTKLFRVGEAAPFIDELHRRWSEWQSERASLSESTSDTGSRMEPGAVFLSCAAADREAARSIRDSLDRAGVDVVLDEDDSQFGSDRERRLRRLVGECSLFVPLVSRHALTVERHFFRSEWLDRLTEATMAAPSGTFILPVVIDDTARAEAALPEELGELEWARLPGGATSPEFVERVVQLQRNFRKASFA